MLKGADRKVADDVYRTRLLVDKVYGGRMVEGWWRIAVRQLCANDATIDIAEVVAIVWVGLAADAEAHSRAMAGES